MRSSLKAQNYRGGAQTNVTQMTQQHSRGGAEPYMKDFQFYKQKFAAQ